MNPANWFNKGYCINCLSSLKNSDTFKCQTCSTNDFDLTLCAICFSFGVKLQVGEDGLHTRSHSFLHIPVFVPFKHSQKKQKKTVQLSHDEELFLLDRMRSTGMNDWDELYKEKYGFLKVSADEALKHFFKYFVGGKIGKHVRAELKWDNFYKENSIKTIESPQNLVKEHPDRYFFAHSKSSKLESSLIEKLYKFDLPLIGYNPKRDEFEHEFNYHAEGFVKQMSWKVKKMNEDEDNKLLTEVKHIILTHYNRAIKSRYTIHAILREHELIAKFFADVKTDAIHKKHSFLEGIPDIMEQNKEMYAHLFGRAHQVLEQNFLENLIINVAKADYLMHFIVSCQGALKEGNKIPVLGQTNQRKRKKVTYNPNKRRLSLTEKNWLKQVMESSDLAEKNVARTDDGP